MAHWAGAQGQVQLAKKSRTHASSMSSLTENHKPKTEKILFFQFWTGRLAESIDVLNSSLAHLAGDLWSSKAANSGKKSGPSRTSRVNCLMVHL